MSTVNRLKHRKKVADQAAGTANDSQEQTNDITSPRTGPETISKHTEEKEKEYEPYYEISQYNPRGVSVTSSVFPHNAALQSNFAIPLGFIVSPIMSTENPEIEVMQKSADKIPRCSNCRAYMNCYNRIQNKKFVCFFCNKETVLDANYDPAELQMQSPLFQCLSPTNYYPKEPAEETFIFLIDITPDSASSKMLYYAVAVMKEVLARTDLDDLCIYFFTYDELLQEYDFSGNDIRCTINDGSIEGNTINLQSCYLRDIREKLFDLLDSLEEMSANNPRRGSNFGKCFDYVFSSLKQTGGKFFVLQSNELIAGEPIFKEQPIKNPNPNIQNPAKKGPSIFETCNKAFMEKYTYKILENDCSIGFFSFCKNYKNLKAITDVLKITSSELKVYSKDNASDLEKFYYEFSYLLGTSNFKNVRVELIINTGWHFTAVYGNFYRIKEYITFQICNYESSRKMAILVAPTQSPPQNQFTPPFCSIQVVTNYQYKRQAYINVSTIVQPVTGFIETAYNGIDHISVITCLAKGYLSSLRMDDLNLSRKRVTDVSSQIYLAALKVFKKQENIPDTIMFIIMAILAMLKSTHSQPDQIGTSAAMDKIIGERNMFQFSGNDFSNYFSPNLFNLTELDESMCPEEGEFVYPPTMQIKFHNVKQGLFLMDVGTALYLFIAKSCDPKILSQVFGKCKFSKNDELNEEILNQQSTLKARQVQSLIRFLREQKSYGWVPLHVVRCGENSLSERSFYLFFYAEKYEEFRSYRMNLEEFCAIISKPNSY